MPEAYERVTAHRRDRGLLGRAIVGTLLPCNDVLGERVKDDSGITWQVDADSVMPCPDAIATPKGTQS